MTPEQQQDVRRFLGRHARALADLLAKYPDQAGAQWHRETATAHEHLKAALGAELKVASGEDTAIMLMLRRQVNELMDANTNSEMAYAVCYASLRFTLRDLRDEAHADTIHQMREYALGLIYDAMSWTPLSERTSDKLAVLGLVIDDAMRIETQEQYMESIRRPLMKAGFHLAP